MKVGILDLIAKPVRTPRPMVSLALVLPVFRKEIEVDPTQARQLAAELLQAADAADGRGQVL
ncbi:MAG TPA: hypothetical protein VF522_13160 [Ramlibacter sp.]|uniref:hypothetical protein n=1 Tax=Ramlibacter sp. TaxID=1917967 RepID=UPI002ED2EE4A